MNYQEHKIQRILNKLKKRLPDTHYFETENYSTVYTLLRSIKSIRGKKCTYKEVVNFYTDYFIKKDIKRKGKGKTKDHYIRTKYYKFTNVRNNINRRKEGLTIAGMGGHPIRLALDNLKYWPDRKIAYLVLHEFGHNYSGKGKGNKNFWNEYNADMFAIRWMRRMIRENIF